MQRVSTEGSGDQAFVDDHRKCHQQRAGAGHHGLAVGLLQNHRDAAGRRVLAGYLYVGVRAESANDGRQQERRRKQWTGVFRDLTGQCKDTGANHDAGTHRNCRRQ